MTSDILNNPKDSPRFLNRNSGLELLRIFAMFWIVLHHITQSLSSSLSIIPINVTQASPVLSHFILTFFFMLGPLGNLTFFLISAWFLLDSKQVKKQKIIYYLVEVWILSVLVLSMFLFFYSGHLALSDIIKSLFPTTFANNWFVTCYLLFYSIHGLLNHIIKTLPQKKLLKLSLGLLFLYVCCNTLKIKLFFASILILWISLYFAMGYLKIYLPGLINSRKINLIVLLGSTGFLLLLTGLTDMLGIKFGIFYDKVYHWGSNYSLFWVLTAFCLLNLFRIFSFKLVFINRISSYMLLVYLIHENLLFRTYIRPLWLNAWYSYNSNANIVITVILFAIGIFIFSFVLAILFDVCFRKMIKKISEFGYCKGSKLYELLESYILQM